MKKKNILISGGAGFIGSHLCEVLLKRGCSIICLDDFYTGKIENISHLLSDSNFRVIRHDIIKPISFKGIDEIYNLACPASPVHYQYDPIRTTKISVLGTLNLLELAKDSHCRFLQASTSEVYGDPEIHPQPETYWGHVNPNGVRSCYDEGKRCAESLCMDFYRRYSLPIKIVRIFNTYGPRMACDDGRVVSNFIVQALLGQDITIYGDGTQTRSFQYIDDLICGMVRMMNSEETFVGPVNLGNPEEYSIRDLATLIVQLVGSSSKMMYQDLPLDDPKKRKPSIALAQEILKWKPEICIREGLCSTIEYFKQTLLNIHYNETCNTYTRS